MPRALQIGIYSPFPSFIFNNNDFNFKKILLTLTFFECVIAFIITILFLYYFKYIYFKIENFIIINFCLSNIIIFCLTVNNVGTILRMRYVFFGLLICLIVANILHLRSNSRKF